jgi:hypothetical protein
MMGSAVEMGVQLQRPTQDDQSQRYSSIQQNTSIQSCSTASIDDTTLSFTGSNPDKECQKQRTWMVTDLWVSGVSQGGLPSNLNITSALLYYGGFSLSQCGRQAERQAGN